MTPLTWPLALAALTSQRRARFAIWMVSNAAWAAIDLRAGLPAQAALMATYAGLAVFGFFRWRPRNGPDTAGRGE